MAKRIFKNPANNYQETVDSGFAIFGTFLFGAIYMIIRNCWTHALLSFAVFFLAIVQPPFWLIAIPVHLVMTFDSPNIIARNYLKKGWVEVIKPAENNTQAANQEVAPTPAATSSPEPKDNFGSNMTLLGLIIVAGFFIIFASNR